MKKMQIETRCSLKSAISDKLTGLNVEKAVDIIATMAIKHILNSQPDEVARTIFLLKSPKDSDNYGGLRSLGGERSFANRYIYVSTEIGNLLEELADQDESNLQTWLKAQQIANSKPQTSGNGHSKKRPECAMTTMEIAFKRAGWKKQDNQTEAEVEAASEATNAEDEANTDRNESILALIDFAIEALEGLRGIFQP